MSDWNTEDDCERLLKGECEVAYAFCLWSQCDGISPFDRANTPFC